MKQFTTKFNTEVIHKELKEVQEKLPFPVPDPEKLDEMPKYEKSEDFKVEQYLIEGIPTERYTYLNATDGAIDSAIWFHGGGFISPLIDMYRFAAEFYCRELNIKEIYFMDYRVAPQFKYPVAHEDAYIVYKALSESLSRQTKNFIAIGDSAGGNLIFSTMQRAVKEGSPLPSKMIALSPWMDLTPDLPSHYYNGQRDALLGVPDVNTLKGANIMSMQLWDSCYATEKQKRLPKAAPFYGDFRGLPPTFISAGQYELLLSDALTTTEIMTASGCDVTLYVESGMFHDYTLIPQLPQSPKALRIIKDFLYE